jgi:hypothetical protein
MSRPRLGAAASSCPMKRGQRRKIQKMTNTYEMKIAGGKGCEVLVVEHDSGRATRYISADGRTAIPAEHGRIYDQFNNASNYPFTDDLIFCPQHNKHSDIIDVDQCKDCRKPGNVA